MSKCKVIAICNQKGVGWKDGDMLELTLADMMKAVMSEKESEPSEGILRHEEGVDLIPSNLELSSLEVLLVNAMNREYTLKNYLEQVKQEYDYILIDCMPSLGMITINALVAADSVIIPVQAHYLPAKGMTQLIQTISRVKRRINPGLNMDGILLTLVDGRTNLAKSTQEAIQSNFGGKLFIFRTTIPMAIKAAEVAAKGMSIFAYEPNSPAAKAYESLVKEVLNGQEKERLRSSYVR